MSTEKIPFAENLAQHLPGSYNKNLALLNEMQMMAMHEDNRRWRLAEQRYKALKSATNRKQAAEEVGNWIRSLKPHAYCEDMRRRMNHLREKYKGA